MFLMKKDNWRIGVLFSQSGATAAVEQTMINGSILAMEEINQAGGVLGRPLSYTHYDPGSSPKKYQEYAHRLLTEDNVKIIFGCYMSSCRKAVLPEIETHHGLLFYPTVYEGFEYSSRCFYTGTTSNQGAPELVQYLTKNYGNNLILVGSNYVFPYQYNRVITDLVIQSNGKILDELYIPIEAKSSDFKRTIKQIAKLKPDAIISTLVGDGIGLFYEAFKNAGFDSERMPIASVATSEAELAQVDLGVATGHLSSTPFFETLQTPEAIRFVKAYKARFGPDAPVTACAEAAYFQIHLYANALEKATSDSPEKIALQLPQLSFNAPQGQIRIDPLTHHTELWPRIGRVNSQNKFDIVWESKKSVKPDPYFVAPLFDEWSAANVLLQIE